MSRGRYSWFEALFGFEESSYVAVKKNMEVKGVLPNLRLVSKANNRSFPIGSFSTPSLAEIRSETEALLAVADLPDMWGFEYDHVPVGDIMQMHSSFPRATFQAASQFNSLEFCSSKGIPEQGVEIYAMDMTQGPACALACAAGTVYRNYFAPITDKSGAVVQVGQTKHLQINNLQSLGEALDNSIHQFWDVENGYVFSHGEDHLEKLNAVLATKSEDERDTLMSLIRVGVHSDVGVTFVSRFVQAPNASQSADDADMIERERIQYESVSSQGQIVTQVYASALSCAYSGLDNRLWEPFARMVLDAAYEATLLVAAQNFLRNNGAGHSRDVFITFLGGGVFGNDICWINDAIARALAKMASWDLGLRVHICHYRRVDWQVQQDIDAEYQARFAEGSAAKHDMASNPNQDIKQYEDGKESSVAMDDSQPEAQSEDI